MKVYLIRHAKTKDAEKGIPQKFDTPIIKSTIDKLLFAHLSPEKVYSSPMSRARQTAKVLFDSFEILDFIHEFIRPKLLNSMRVEESNRFWKKHLPDIRADHDWKFDGSESFNQIKGRAKKLYSFLKKQPHGSVVVVSHGTFMRHFLGYLGLKDKYTFAYYSDNLHQIKWDNLEIKEVEI